MAFTIRADSGRTLAEMAVTGHNQNARVGSGMFTGYDQLGQLFNMMLRPSHAGARRGAPPCVFTVICPMHQNTQFVSSPEAGLRYQILFKTT